MSREDLKFVNFPGQGREEVRYATDQSQVLLTALPVKRLTYKNEIKGLLYVKRYVKMDI